MRPSAFTDGNPRPASPWIPCEIQPCMHAGRIRPCRCRSESESCAESTHVHNHFSPRYRKKHARPAFSSNTPRVPQRPPSIARQIRYSACPTAGSKPTLGPLCHPPTCSPLRYQKPATRVAKSGLARRCNDRNLTTTYPPHAKTLKSRTGVRENPIKLIAQNTRSASDRPPPPGHDPLRQPQPVRQSTSVIKPRDFAHPPSCPPRQRSKYHQRIMRQRIYAAFAQWALACSNTHWNFRAFRLAIKFNFQRGAPYDKVCAS
jgi:hypothetical protein